MIIAGSLNLTLIKGCTFEAITLTMLNSLGTPVNLTGYTVTSEVRLEPETPVIIDLNPSITSAAGGVVTIPAIVKATTDTYTIGTYQWDLLLLQASPDNKQQMLRGYFFIRDRVTGSS